PTKAGNRSVVPTIVEMPSNAHGLSLIAQCSNISHQILVWRVFHQPQTKDRGWNAKTDVAIFDLNIKIRLGDRGGTSGPVRIGRVMNLRAERRARRSVGSRKHSNGMPESVGTLSHLGNYSFSRNK